MSDDTIDTLRAALRGTTYEATHVAVPRRAVFYAILHAEQAKEMWRASDAANGRMAGRLHPRALPGGSMSVVMADIIEAIVATPDLHAQVKAAVGRMLAERGREGE